MLENNEAVKNAYGFFKERKMNSKIRSTLKKIWPFKGIINKLDRLYQELEEKTNSIADLDKRLNELHVKNEELNSNIYDLTEEKQKLVVELESERTENAAIIERLKTEIKKAEEQIFLLNNQLEIHEAQTVEINSLTFWEKHYQNNGTSGTGSYNRLAAFKADFINKWLEEHQIRTVIELGCGDGNQLGMIHYQSYTGVDVSETIIKKNKDKFANDEGKVFYVRYPKESYMNKKYELSISMDVIFHLLEENVYKEYMKDLFECSEKYVIIYSSNHEEYTKWPEYRHRKFIRYIQENIPNFKLVEFVPNKYPHVFGEEETTSESDFYIFEKSED